MVWAFKNLTYRLQPARGCSYWQDEQSWGRQREVKPPCALWRVLGGFMRHIQVPSVPSGFILVSISFQAAAARPIRRDGKTGRQGDSKRF